MKFGQRLANLFKAKLVNRPLRPRKQRSYPKLKLNRFAIKREPMAPVSLSFKAPKKPRPRWHRWLVAAGLVLLLYVVFWSDLFMLTNLQITGLHLTQEDVVKQKAFPSGFRRANAVTFAEGRVRKRLEDLHQIKEVKFHKDLINNTLTIEIVEHQSSIIWLTSGERFVVNKFGAVYDKAEEGSPLLVVEDLKNIPVSIGQRVVTPEFIEFVTSFTANLPRKTNIVIERVMVPETTFELEMKTNAGWTIILDTTKPYEDQLNNLVRVLREMEGTPPREYIDLRIGKKVFYK